MKASPRFAASLVALLLGTLGASTGCVEPDQAVEPAAVSQVTTSTDGMVVAAQPLAAQVGADILARGGNAADAAVATAFAVSVVEPTMNSIGGRTQVLVRTPDGAAYGIDATTQAPATYDPDTAPQAGYGYPTVGVPGALAGLAKLHAEHGSLPWAELVAPAVALARDGFSMLPGEALRQGFAADQIREFEGSRAHFLKEDGSPYQAGDLFVQEDLAQTLEAIADGGPSVFYEGHLAEAMVADLSANGAAVTMESLRDYEALDSRIVRGSYRGLELVGTDIPASGAVTIGILHMLENFDMASMSPEAWASVMGQAIAKGFEFRAMLGTEEGAQTFTDKTWASERAAEIVVPVDASGGMAQRTSPEVTRLAAASQREHDWDGRTWGASSSHTTHLSTADDSGMFVSLTQTIGPNMGSKVASPGLGFLYAATLGGYLGRVEPLERARSSISPLLVLDGGEPKLVLGAAGGARIVSAVVQAVARVVDQGMTLEDALAAPRVHPTAEGFAMETTPGDGWTSVQVEAVRAMGFEIDETDRVGAFGRIHGIEVTSQGLKGVADPDWEGAAAAPVGH